MKSKSRHNSSNSKDGCEKNMNYHIKNCSMVSKTLGRGVGGEKEFIDGEILSYE